MSFIKKISFPTAHSILLIIAGLVAILTWLVPAGQYDRLSYNKETNSFHCNHLGNDKIVVANQNTLDSLNIEIPIEKFTNGDIWKPISIPGTYHKLDPSPQGIIAFIKSPLKGIMGVSDIVLLILIIGGLIGIVNATGAFEAGNGTFNHFSIPINPVI